MREPQLEPDLPGESPAAAAGGTESTAAALQVAVDNGAPNGSADLADQQAALLGSVGEFLEHDDLAAGLLALAGELKQRFQCRRVVVGLARPSDTLQVGAISQQAVFDPRSAAVRALAEAMTEACEQDAVIRYPAAEGDWHVVEAHRALAADTEARALCTIPLCHRGETVGALLFEGHAGVTWSPTTVALLERLAALLAPLVRLRQENARAMRERLAIGLREALGALAGPRHILGKSLGALTVLLLVAAQLIQVPHRVAADAELVPLERRIIAAPIDGYIRGVDVRPGVTVRAGDVLVRLDTRDLELERSDLDNELRNTEAEVRAAMADNDRKAMAVHQARQRQARARLALIDQQIARAAVRAPIDGLVVAGDLSQALGAPVERGETLLELAPGDDFELQLRVDEQEVAYLTAGQHGHFTPTAAPAARLPLEVESVRPVGEAGQGVNRFRVTARLDGAAAAGLRPGQTGIGKIEVGEASLLWLWTHEFVHWLRLRLWAFSG